MKLKTYWGLAKTKKPAGDMLFTVLNGMSHALKDGSLKRK